MPPETCRTCAHATPAGATHWLPHDTWHCAHQRPPYEPGSRAWMVGGHSACVFVPSRYTQRFDLR